MSAYLGIPGRLVPIYSTPSMKVSSQPIYSTERTLGGKVKAQLVGLTRRQWDVSADAAEGMDVGTLLAFAGGEWGKGPFTWVTPTAPVTNMLTPEQASCDPSTVYTAGVIAGGPLNLGADGWAGRSFLNPDTSVTFRFGGQGTPVIPGQKVTASAYVVGAGSKVQIRWEDAAGAFISAVTSTAAGVAGSATRVPVTATAPANAALAYVNAVSTSQGARPAITWTASAFPWAPGKGCPKAIVSAVDRSETVASEWVEGQRLTDMSFTITEVG